MKTEFSKKCFCYAICVASLLLSSCKSPVNTVFDSHFDKDGNSLDSLKEVFMSEPPKSLTFYVEVSGSMNGFFRSNKATRFKKDAWSVLSNFGNNNVFVLSDDGIVSGRYAINDFRKKMNTGGFVSSKETLVPKMLESILDNLNYSDGECAVLISDMKYSPEKQKDINVLLDQYQVDIRNVIGKCPGLSICIVMAKSNYLAANGTLVEDNSPYYYVVLGKDRNVAYMRNCIATLLEDDYGDSIESGFDYKAPSYSFGIPDNCLQMFDQPTFTGYDTQFSDTCKINLNIDLSHYRWLIADEDVFRECLKVKSCYGSEVCVGNVRVEVDNHYDKQFKRKAVAKVEIKLCNMYASDSDVIEWSITHPEFAVTREFTDMMSAESEADLGGSFSVDRFVSGVFNAIQNTWDLTANRILISKIK